MFHYFRLTFPPGLLVLCLFAWESVSSRSKATSIMQGKASLIRAGSTAHLTPEPSQTSHAKCPRHAGHGVSRRLTLAVPKARLGSQQGWSWGVPQRSFFTDCTRIISMSRGREGLAEGCLLQAAKQGLRDCISYPDFLFPLAHPRDVLSLSLRRPPYFGPCLPVRVSPGSQVPAHQAARWQPAGDDS